MCLSAGPANFDNTVLYAGLGRHPSHGEVHVVGYQNRASSPGTRPNAMLLLPPMRDPLRPENFLDMSACRTALDDMFTAVVPRSRGLRSFYATGDEETRLFDHEICAPMTADDTATVMDALARAPDTERLAPSAGIEVSLARYGDRMVALCRFTAKAAPLFLWYRSHTPETIVVPAVDDHKGDDLLDTPVCTEHWLLTGCPDATGGTPVPYADDVPPRLRPFLPNRVAGRHFWHRKPNGDLFFPANDARTGHMARIYRLMPTAPLQTP